MKNGMEELARKSQECIAKAIPALKKAEGVAVTLKLSGNARELDSIQSELARDRFTVMIFGRFRCGKSVILNALLGRSPIPIPGLKPGEGPMPVDINPCTAVPTKIYYSDKPEVFAIRDAGNGIDKREQWKFEDYIKQGKQKTSKAETELFFQGIKGFEVGYPTPFCKGGVELFDTPGTDDDPTMDLITFAAAKDADAAVLALAHPGTMGMQEREYLQQLMDDGLTSLLTIVNARDPDPPEVVAMPPSNATVSVIWNRVVAPIKGRKEHKGELLESEDVFFMNALQAFKGRMHEDEEAVRKSGVLKFEERLANYLQAEPRYVHLQRFLGRAEPVLNSIEQAIDKQIKALEVDQQGFQNKLAELLPKLADVPKRARRIPEIIKFAKAQAQASIQNSLEELYADIERDLPEYMTQQPLRSIHNEEFTKRWKAIVMARVSQKALAKEAQDIALEYIRQRVKRWQEAPLEENGAPRALKLHMDNMMADLTDVVTAIERQYEEIQLNLSGWTPPSAATGFKPTSLANRVSAAAFGLATGQIDYIATGGMGGWNAIGRDLIGRLAVAVPLMLIFGPQAIVVVPLAALGGLVWSIAGGVDKLEANVKKAVVNALLNGYPANEKEAVPAFGGLASEPRRMRSTIAEAVEKKFGEIETSVMKVVNDQIQAEDQALRNQQEDALRSAADRAGKLEVLKGYADQIRQSRNELKQALTSAAQSNAPRQAQAV